MRRCKALMRWNLVIETYQSPRSSPWTRSTSYSTSLWHIGLCSHIWSFLEKIFFRLGLTQLIRSNTFSQLHSFHLLGPLRKCVTISGNCSMADGLSLVVLKFVKTAVVDCAGEATATYNLFLKRFTDIKSSTDGGTCAAKTVPRCDSTFAIMMLLVQIVLEKRGDTKYQQIIINFQFNQTVRIQSRKEQMNTTFKIA